MLTSMGAKYATSGLCVLMKFWITFSIAPLHVSERKNV
jgi:hypothetical protein